MPRNTNKRSGKRDKKEEPRSKKNKIESTTTASTIQSEKTPEQNMYEPSGQNDNWKSKNYESLKICPFTPPPELLTEPESMKFNFDNDCELILSNSMEILIRFHHFCVSYKLTKELSRNELQNLLHHTQSKTAEQFREDLAETFQFKRTPPEPSIFTSEERKQNYDRLYSHFVGKFKQFCNGLVIDDMQVYVAYQWKTNMGVNREVKINHDMSVYISLSQLGFEYRMYLNSKLSINELEYLLRLVKNKTDEELRGILNQSQHNSEITSGIEKQTVVDLCQYPGTTNNPMKEWEEKIVNITIESPIGMPPIGKEMLQSIIPAIRENVHSSLDIQRLRWWTHGTMAYLNDLIVSKYLDLIEIRSKSNLTTLPKVHVMNTHFLECLNTHTYSGVRTWTKGVDIFTFEIILIPVFIPGCNSKDKYDNGHWCMAIIHMINKTIKYYDSMGAPNKVVLHALAEYLKAESLDKKKVEFDMSGWQVENVKNIPQQDNPYDCGVFSCMYAEFISRNQPIVFTQNDMRYFRMKMVYEICTEQMIT